MTSPVHVAHRPEPNRDLAWPLDSPGSEIKTHSSPPASPRSLQLAIPTFSSPSMSDRLLHSSSTRRAPTGTVQCGPTFPNHTVCVGHGLIAQQQWFVLCGCIQKCRSVIETSLDRYTCRLCLLAPAARVDLNGGGGALKKRSSWLQVPGA